MGQELGKKTRKVRLYETHVYWQHQQSHVEEQLEVLMKWGRGDRFPSPVFGYRHCIKTPDHLQSHESPLTSLPTRSLWCKHTHMLILVCLQVTLITAFIPEVPAPTLNPLGSALFLLVAKQNF